VGELPAMQKLVIDANKNGLNLNLKELFHYKDLLYTLAYRDFKVRYAQTFLGFLWAFLQPAATLIIFSLVFGRAVKVDTGNVPYPLFALTGMVVWTYFSYVLSQGGNSIVGAQNMVKKIYFPRLIIPLSKAIVGLIDLAIILLFLGGMLIYFQYPLLLNIIFLPLFLLLTIMAGLGVGIWLSSLTIRYRDFQHIIPFIVQLGLYASPIAYPSSLIPENYQLIYHLNPVAGVVEGFRWSILGVGEVNLYSYLSFLVILILLITSLYYFKSVEKVMADIV
jgi:lipopolysaccharide transport system permease protein